MDKHQREVIKDLLRTFRVVVDKIDRASGSPHFSANTSTRCEAVLARAERLLKGV